MCLADDNLYETAVEMFSDVLANYSKFIRNEDYTLLHSLLHSPWGEAKYNRLVRGDYEFDSLQFGHLMLAFGDARVQHLAETAATDPRSSQFLDKAVGLLAGKGTAVHEDQIFVPALEFWSTFLFTLTDEAYSVNLQHPPWVTAAIPYALLVVDSCWHKIHLPPAEGFDTWDKADQTAFKYARDDVSEILQQVYLLIGVKLFSMFADLLLKSVQNRDVGSDLEAAMFCLSQLPDCVSNNEQDQYLDQIFASDLLPLLTGPDSTAPFRTKQALFTLVNRYSPTEYFKRVNGQKYLPMCLNFMAGLVGSPSLGRTAATSINSLCKPCRAVLIPELPAFLQQYSQMSNMPSLDGQVKESLIGAVSFIIQALPDDTSKVASLQQLLNFVEADQNRSLQLQASASEAIHSSNQAVTANTYAEGLEIGLLALRCLVKIGLGVRVPDDQPIDLDKPELNSEFWTKGHGAIIQQQILRMLTSTLEAYKGEGEVIEEACLVFRAGFTESEPGPLVFQPAIIAQFLLGFGPDTKRIGTVMKTACTFVSSYNKVTERIDEVAGALLAWVAQLLHQLGGMLLCSCYTDELTSMQNLVRTPKSHSMESISSFA